ncbi:hypothetical protein [Lawsonella clevelandensis]|uniref:Alkaline shock response membrane anchor protein AmaP n=1 Tax=Lawsonella clevelandensis TaxID=1528099 RepID=A0A0M4MZF6_9ACTN|nr:hypothetical protein [Lawsonella clevelandensis]ALE18811.1 hypothetical protein AL705_03045 [Lawsonella clevelandensis]ALE34480.1 hypothetical protein IY73_02915 [Lawsonella clevelandensis]MDU7193180.1 hypothetical protein [Lawsonella clevelandensis]VHO00254.1 hypothetical protein LC603019_00595 [Lawsonella clevelandensis]
MTRGAEAYVRFITFFVGLVLTGLGVVCILWYAGVEPLTGWLNDSWPTDHFDGAENANWWFPALVVAAILIVLLCLRSITLLTKRRNADTLVLDANQPGGAIRIELSDVGRALARDLETLPAVRSASSRAINDRGVPTLDIDLQSPADVPITTLIKIAEQVSADVPAAVSYCGPTTRVFLQLDKVRRPDGTTSSARYRGTQEVHTDIPHDLEPGKKSTSTVE